MYKWHSVIQTYHKTKKNWEALSAGISQRNRVGPQIWVAVSTPLFAIMQANGFVAQIICTISKAKTELAGLAFVDDTDLITNNASNKVTQASMKMQKSLSTWHGLLQATSRELVPEKSFWYLINFKWNNNKWQYK